MEWGLGQGSGEVGQGLACGHTVNNGGAGTQLPCDMTDQVRCWLGLTYHLVLSRLLARGTVGTSLGLNKWVKVWVTLNEGRLRTGSFGVWPLKSEGM